MRSSFESRFFFSFLDPHFVEIWHENISSERFLFLQKFLFLLSLEKVEIVSRNIEEMVVAK